MLPPRVGEERPAAVRAEVNLDMARVSPEIRKEWESLRPEDVVFLLAVKGVDDSDRMITNGASDKLSMAEKYGIKCLRTAEVIQVLDSQGRPLLGPGEQKARNSFGQCRLHLKLDPDMYKVSSEYCPLFFNVRILTLQ